MRCDPTICSKPRESVNPRKKGSCLSCGRMFDPKWIVSDRTMSDIFDRLARSMQYGEAIEKDPVTGHDALTDDFLSFWAECQARERAGREKFGLTYLVRDNETEALEEFTDGANYLAFSSLQAVRSESDDDEIDLVMTAMYHAFKGHQAARRLRAKRHGHP